MSFLKYLLIRLVLFIVFIISLVVFAAWWSIATAATPALSLDGVGQFYLPIALNKDLPTATATATATPTATMAPPTSTLAPSTPTTTVAAATSTPLPSTPTATVAPPTVTPTFSGPLTLFGAHIPPGASSADPIIITRAVDAKLSGIRYNGLFWSNVEPVQGERDWSQLTSFEQEMLSFSENGLTPIVIVRSTPPWAQKVPNFYCGPIKEDALDDFANFMGELVARYSRPPYNVIYWEIWNEPDIDSVLLTPGQHPAIQLFGCWGDGSDPYYGGGYYAEMLKKVYPAVKNANPAAQLLIGGLNLDCDPTAPPEGLSCLPAKFLEGILQNGGGNYFDIVSYHGYAFWWPSFGFSGDWDLQHLTWSHRGGVVLGKADFIREVLAQYKLEKPLILTEASLACYDSNQYCQCNDPNTECLQDEFLAAQANYAVRLYTRLWANGLLGATWYQLNYNGGWRHTDLLDQNQDPKAAYITVQFLATLLEGAAYTGSLSTSTVEGYSFRKGETEYQIYWTNDLATTAPLSLPENTQVVYNKLGQHITPSGMSIMVGFEPIIIESRPAD